MLAMSESFVDLTYRGLQLGRRIKLSEVRPTTGYLEVPFPMPVGTAIAILTDDTVALEATVVGIHEQVGGSDRPPGMVVRPKLEADAAKKWWQARVALPELDKKPIALVPQPPIVATVAPKRSSRDTQISAVPELLEEPQDTAVMEAVDPLAADPPARDSHRDIGEDNKSTVAMDAVDLAALGLDPTSTSSTTDELPTVSDDDLNGDSKPGGRKKKRKR